MVPGLTGSVRSVEADQESLHRRNEHRPLLMLFSLPVPGHTLRLVHRQHGGHEQHRQGGTSVEHG